MSTALALRGPGIAWLPVTLRTPAYWRMVARFALLGPLVGGIPYAWLVVTLPLVYAIGVVPAAVAGLLYAAWWHQPGLRPPGKGWRATLGALCGGAACAAVAMAFASNDPGLPFMFLAAHGVPAAIVLALVSPARRKVQAPAAVSVAVSTAGGLASPHGAGVAGACRRGDDSDLHARADVGRACG